MPYDAGIRRRVALVTAVLALLAPALAPADIQEQRARLPPPAECTDPVEGVWMSHTFYPHVSEWYIFTLTVRHVAGDPTALEGSVHSMFWSGVAERPEPPACGQGDRRSVNEPARGTHRAGLIQFGGTAWQSAPDSCTPVMGGYNPDRFSGQIDPRLQEFQTRVEDGGIFQGEPTVFRRVRCLEPGAQPHVTVEPPPFYPRREGGCGCGR
jgi:hypothetical protein